MFAKTLATPEESAKRIKESKVIGLVLPDLAGFEVVSSAAALAYGLKKIEKTVNVFGPKELPTKEVMPWPNVHDTADPLREFIISFDLTRSPIKELKYERDEKRLDIILSPNGPAIRREDIEFRFGALRYDLIVTLGLKNLEAASRNIAQVPELFFEKPILNIDADPENSLFGDLNLVNGASASKQPTLPELVYKVLLNLNALTANPQAATALLAGLHAATKNFTRFGASTGVFAFADELLKLGADGEVARRSLAAPRTFAEEQLAARAIARSRLDEKNRITWSLLNKDDFNKTVLDPEALSAIFEKIAASMPPARFHVLLWQNPADEVIKSFVAAESKAEEEKLKTAWGLPFQKGYVARDDYYLSFPAAEEHILQLLAAVNGLQ